MSEIIFPKLVLFTDETLESKVHSTLDCTNFCYDFIIQVIQIIPGIICKNIK